jgi:2-oxoglutarate ferredoxin oxidoreductase subunit alpha
MKLIQGNEAVVEAAIKAGCRFFAGYPITPSSEIMHSMAEILPRRGGVFVQMEDEVASINAAIGASMAGMLSMTATSGPGFSLMQESIGYAAMAEIPVVIVDVMRAGPSTGIPTAPNQGDVFQALYGSHGDYPVIVLCPSDVLDSYVMTAKAFELTEKCRTPAIILSDEIIGHMRESVELPEIKPVQKAEMPVIGRDSGIYYTGLANKDGRIITELDEYEELIKRLLRKINENLASFKLENGDADTVIFAYGSTYRSAKAVMKMADVGVFKAETISPFPETALRKVAKKVSRIIVAEMNAGKVVKEVERIASRYCDVVSLSTHERIDPLKILKVIRNES